MFLKKMNINNTVKILDDALTRFIRKANEDTVSVYGGKLSIASIKKNVVNWMAIQDKNSYTTKKAFMQAYRNNLIKMWYRSKEDSLSLRKRLLEEEFQ